MMKIVLKISGALLFTFLNGSCNKDAVNSIKDVDGNVYNTIRIGNQVWMRENLRAISYRNGDLIGTTVPATMDVSGESTPKYQWASDGKENIVAVNGRLYTWFVLSDNRNVCPAGWHIPSDSEWTTLTDFLTASGYGYKGTGYQIAKSMASSTYWATDGTAGTVGNDMTTNNRSGFTALPGGYRASYGPFYDFGYVGWWWSSTEFDTSNAYTRTIFSRDSTVYRNAFNKLYGRSIRCIKD